MNRVNVFAIHLCINEGYGLIRIFTEKNTDFPHEIVACLIAPCPLFNIGITFASFNLDGNIPDSIHWFIISVNGSLIKYLLL